MKLIIAGVLAAGLLYSAERAIGQGVIHPGSPAPEFKLAGLDGKAFKSSQLKGSVVLLDLWATWCEPCLANIPIFNRLHEKFGTLGLKVVGIAVESGWAKDIKPHAAKLGIKYPVVVGTEDIVQRYDLIGFPTTYLIGKNGRVVKKYVGTPPDREEEMEKNLGREIEELLR